MKGHVSSIQHPAFSLSHLWHAALQRPARWLELYRQRRELASLSDATLQDLGLSRADIQQEAERPFWDDPLRK
ncbi:MULTISPECIES: DUF1127 domain-containing protein [Pseudomonas]|jgi:uncharacterized protein YjiS (DUF1127 family)|uniref:Uncharacterized conserved small protein n=1 Tax=Pseudomonas putida TaxID=303 RepID=A0A379PLR7_PSEPU|nr:MULTISPECIES: DUF1127 domain-containing protein [Pseudomonas]MBG6124089.1 uncharacterized protein YjiS (DUF1127 family) [Pseudomonas sp. M2]MBM7399920.1 uncharacterized protein YjiS (DUF1127 family) [Pseudomonas sp. M5]NSX20632.1 DUF1127 domain-containing protein [Pseudomonas putida]SUF08864.1 Uncharacterized conserved small protein [Pseudomonas putida]HDS1747908.1 DUF1127 domain-containing protein [Pseudomonas putida]